MGCALLLVNNDIIKPNTPLAQSLEQFSGPKGVSLYVSFKLTQSAYDDANILYEQGFRNRPDHSSTLQYRDVVCNLQTATNQQFTQNLKNIDTGIRQEKKGHTKSGQKYERVVQAGVVNVPANVWYKINFYVFSYSQYRHHRGKWPNKYWTDENPTHVNFEIIKPSTLEVFNITRIS